MAPKQSNEAMGSSSRTNPVSRLSRLAQLQAGVTSSEVSASYNDALKAIVGLSQHEDQVFVLKALAEAFGKDLVDPGSARTAAAVAGASARAAVPSVDKAMKIAKSNKTQGGYPPQFVEAHKSLFATRESLKRVSPVDKAAVAQASAAIRSSFRNYCSKGAASSEAAPMDN